MSVQQFSAENFHKIWDLRTRRGEDLTLFFPDLAPLNKQIRKVRRDKKTARKAGPLSDGQKIHFQRLESKLLHEKEIALEECLEFVAREVNSLIDQGKFSLGLMAGPVRNGKKTYALRRELASQYFTARQVERNLKSAFSIVPGQRNLISEQLLASLQDKTRKQIIRSDLRSFYENIDHTRLLEIVANEPRISRTTVIFVKQLLSDFSGIVGRSVGVPRGVGISSMLAEIYLQQLDKTIERMPGVLAHLRYVDDMVTIFSTGDLAEARKNFFALESQVKSFLLELHPDKTRTLLIPHSVKGRSCFLDFLGYRYTITNDSVSADITPNRLAKYQRRTERAFEACSDAADAGRALKLLRERIEFLTSNTRLSNSKQNALIGIYYSNCLLPGPTMRLQLLDSHLSRMAERHALPNAMERYFHSGLFVSGFSRKRYRKYGPAKISSLTKVWADAK